MMPAVAAANSTTSRPRTSSTEAVLAMATRRAGWGRPTSTGRAIRCPSRMWRSCPYAPMRWAVGSLLRVSEDGSIERTLITGRVLYHETLREAIARNVAKDLGDIALPLLPIGLQPFTVAEFFPTPGLSEYYDPRQHAIALCYVVPIAGDCKPQDETLDVEWVDPKSDVMDTFVAQMVNGHGRIVRQALAWAGI